ncbi:hypothetical protein [Archangium lipolyticum]|uniref:hypothetical protein n=1 Tax=Archangium lipolyticum TaxID=2970465 RepID=UPI00214A09FB|nr:hypothetical protein [Archangium lipolyticum]
MEAFLETGEPPIYFGFGSMRAPHGLGQAMVQAARALERTLQPGVTARALSSASSVRSDGARVAAQHVISANPRS